MAKAIFKEVDEIITVKKKGVILELSTEEAAALYYITRRIGGSDKNSPRKFTEAVCNSLAKLGFGPMDYDAPLTEEKHRAVYFKDDTLKEFNKRVLDCPIN